MADKVTAEVKLGAPVLIGREDYATHFTELAGHIVKAAKGKLFVAEQDTSTGEWSWSEVKDGD